ncbi:MAG: NAD(P)H-binding protein [Bacteroidetes bacterium]|nr:NAD(P)H-binding protein [Bacteroidota bacterium]
MKIGNSKSAIIFGSTGLIGGFLLKQLLADDRYGEIKIFVRKSTGINDHKVDEVIIDFKNPEEFRKMVKADEVFCCLGSTIKKAGSRENFRRVDYEWVRWCAVCAKENGVKNFLVVSSLGAAADSANFYYQTKGEMEKAVSVLGFEKCVILRPSMLLGWRKEIRLKEWPAILVMTLFWPVTPAKYKAISAKKVAKAMVVAANDESVNGILESNVIRRMGK